MLFVSEIRVYASWSIVDATRVGQQMNVNIQFSSTIFHVLAIKGGVIQKNATNAKGC